MAENTSPNTNPIPDPSPTPTPTQQNTGGIVDLGKRFFKGIVKTGSFVVGLFTTLAAKLLLGKNYEREMERAEQRRRAHMVEKAVKNSRNNPGNEDKQEKNSHNTSVDKENLEPKQEHNAPEPAEKSSAETIKDETRDMLIKALNVNSCEVKEIQSADGKDASIAVVLNGELKENAITIEIDSKGNVINDDNEPGVANIVSHAYLSASIDELGDGVVPSSELISTDMKNVSENVKDEPVTVKYNNIEFTFTQKTDDDIQLDVAFTAVDGYKKSLTEPVHMPPNEISNPEFVCDMQEIVYSVCNMNRDDFYREMLREDPDFAEHDFEEDPEILGSELDAPEEDTGRTNDEYGSTEGAYNTFDKIDDMNAVL